MEFGWHKAKDDWTRRHRGFGFADILPLFAGDYLLEWEDVRDDYGEARMVTVGLVGGTMVTVVYTDRGLVRWIISARIASRKEWRLWHAKFG